MDCISLLPVEIVEQILSHLDGRTLWNCLSVNLYLRSIANQNKFWGTPCALIGLDPDDIPPPQCLSSFGLCTLAKEWCDAKSRAWRWKIRKTKTLSIPFKPNYVYRSRIMCYNDQEQHVEILEIRNENIHTLHTISLIDNVEPDYNLITCNMNSKYCSVTVLSYIVIYKGYRNLNFHMALGIDGSKVIEISNNMENYKPDNHYVFDPVYNNGDILLIPLRKNSLDSGPMYVVNLITKTITKLPVNSDCYYYQTVVKYLAFYDYGLLVFDLDGKLLFNRQDISYINTNKDFILSHDDTGYVVYELLNFKEIRHSVNANTDIKGGLFTIHPLLNYFYIFNYENKKLQAHDIRSGLKIWESVFEPSQTCFNGLVFDQGYLKIDCRSYESSDYSSFLFEAETGRAVKETEKYHYLMILDSLEDDQYICNFVV